MSLGMSLNTTSRYTFAGAACADDSTFRHRVEVGGDDASTTTMRTLGPRLDSIERRAAEPRESDERAPTKRRERRRALLGFESRGVERCARKASASEDRMSLFASIARDYGRPEAPLLGYATLLGAFGSLLGGVALLLGRKRRAVSLGDVALIGVATHKLSRLVATDKVTSVVRAPFARRVCETGPGTCEDEGRGEGLRYAIGELLTCPYCVGPWIATGLTATTLAAPRFGRTLASIFVAVTIADTLHDAHHALTQPQTKDEETSRPQRRPSLQQTRERVKTDARVVESHLGEARGAR